MSINAAKLKDTMVAAVKDELAEQWPGIKDYAETEAKKIAETIKMIGKMVAAGKLKKSAAKLHIRIQKNAARTVLLTIEGLGLLAVENAINAAIRAIRKMVNDALGFALI